MDKTPDKEEQPKSLKDNSIYRWVKASERTPTFSNSTIWRYGDSHKAIQQCDIDIVIKRNRFDLLAEYEWLEKVEADQQELWQQFWKDYDSGIAPVDKYLLIPKQ